MAAVFYVLLTLLVILIVIYVLVTWNFNYWKKKKVPYPTPVPFFGNYLKFLTLQKHNAYIAQEICEQFPDEPYIGTLIGTKPALLVQDPEIIKLIMAKDFSYFCGREVSDYSHREINTQNMFFTFGDRWKVIRQNTSPLLTTSKVKNMFHLVENCTHKLEELLEYEILVKMSSEVDVRSLAARFNMDCICNCGFGIDPNTMGKDVENNTLKKIADQIFESSKIRGWYLIARTTWPAAFYAAGLRVFSTTITDYFHKFLTEVFEQRKITASTRNDFIDLLLNMKKDEYISSESIMSSTKGQTVTLKIDEEFLVAQCVVFFAAGFETSASITSFTLYELARHQDVQEKVLKEVDEYFRKRSGKIDYDCVSQLPYLDACIHEAMRLYPVLSVITREVMEDYTMPNGLHLEKGLRIHLPVYHMHHNYKFFPEPEKFKPERFLPENRDQIQQYTYMPFGEGHRMCIGKKVGLMQLYAGLVTILKKYRVEFCERTPTKVVFNPAAIVTQSTEGLPLKLIPRN